MKERISLLVILFLLFPLRTRAALPLLEAGDLVFQTSDSPQSQVIQIATGSRYSHVGIVDVSRNGQIYIVEAIARVGRTPLASWIARGQGGRYAVFRLGGFGAGQKQAFVAAANRYLGRAYDMYFTSHNEELYCSELVDYAARDAGFSIGHYQRLGSLKVSDPRVIGLMKSRWQGHPLCRGLGSFSECLPNILEDKLITPLSLTEDERLREIYSNY
jgi:hypothetical protein